jgi:hypothetical protein
VILPNVNLVEFFRKWITEGETSPGDITFGLQAERLIFLKK